MLEDREIEVPHDIASFVAELRRLADALESGEGYATEIDGEAVVIPADAQFMLVHEREDGEEELEFQISWSSADADEEDEADDEDEADA